MFRYETHRHIRERTVWALLKLQSIKWVKIRWRGSFGGVAAYVVIWSLLVYVCGAGRYQINTINTIVLININTLININ